MTTPYIPLYILNQILLLLPFGSILDCKLVSKEWKNLIEDPEFFKRYRDTSLALFYFKNSVYSPIPKQNSVYCLLPRDQRNITITNFTVNRIPFDLEDGDGIREFLSEPSKGIACVVTNNNRLLCYNLFTGASHTTDFPVWKHSEDIRSICCGFGYDCHDDDYKIMLKYKLKGMPDDSLYWVYSLRNKEWKAFKGFPYAAYRWPTLLSIFDRKACSFNGVLHWVFLKRGARKAPEKYVISTYDLHTCMFGEMPLPTDDCNLQGVLLFELGGQLCCKIRNKHGLTNSFWTMREYGVSESWEMLFSTYNIPMTKWEEPAMLYESRDGRKVVLFFSLWDGTLNWDDVNNGGLERIQSSAWEKIRRRSLAGYGIKKPE